MAASWATIIWRLGTAKVYSIRIAAAVQYDTHTQGGEFAPDRRHVTNEKGADVAPSHVTDLIGGADGARTRDLRRDRPAF